MSGVLAGPKTGATPPSGWSGSGGAGVRGTVRAHLPALLLLAGYLVIVCITFRDYGITFDEKWHSDYGSRILGWYASGMSDRQSLELPILVLGHADPNYANMSYYGGFFDTVAEIAARVSPLGVFETRHLMNALFGVAGAGFAYLLGLALAGRLAGFLAALFLMLTPFYYGHAFNNPKDIPFAVLYVASLYGIVRIVRAFPAPGWRLVGFTGVAIGLTMAVRFAGVMLLAYLACAFAAWAAGRPRPELIESVKRFGVRFTACAAIAYAVMLPWWPAALLSPVAHPLRTLRALGAFQWNYAVRFDGRDILASELPWYYMEKYALLTLPEPVLIGLVAALLFGGIELIRRPSRRMTTLAIGSVALAILFPLVYADLTRATVYDAQRHFLFIFPPLVVLAAAGAAAALRHRAPVAWTTALLLCIGLALTVDQMVRLHPHQYIYFNRVIAGGLQGAHEKYETDYWGNGFKEAAEWVRANYAGTAAQPVRIAGCAHRLSTMYFLPREAYRYAGSADDPHVFLGSRRFDCWDTYEGPTVYTVQRVGVPLVLVKEVAPEAAALRRRTGPAQAGGAAR